MMYYYDVKLRGMVAWQTERMDGYKGGRQAYWDMIVMFFLCFYSAFEMLFTSKHFLDLYFPLLSPLSPPFFTLLYEFST